MQLPESLLAPLEIGLNRYLAEDEQALDALARLDGKVIGLRLRELDLQFFMGPHRGGVQIMSQHDGAPDAGIESSLPTLARAFLQPETQQQLVLSGAICIEGDADLVNSFLDILQSTDFDPEEWLSRYIGDVAAYRAGQFMRGVLDFGRRGLDGLMQGGSRLLQDNSGDLVGKDEAQDWLDAVDQMRTDLDRAEARLQRLQNRMEQG